MFDIRAIRKDAEFFDKGWSRRGLSAQTPSILRLDEDRRAVQTELQELQAKRNEESKKIGQIKKEGGDAQAQMAAVAEIKDQMSALDIKDGELGTELKALLSSLPNLMADDVPDGDDEDDNVEIHKWGDIKSQSGPDHVEIGEALGLIDFETAAKMSGARFTILKGAMARMERALAQFFLDIHTAEHGLTEISPPLLVRDAALYGTGQLPKFGEDLYKVDYTDYDALSRFFELKKQVGNKLAMALGQGGLEALKEFDGIRKNLSASHFLIPTAEVPITNMVAGDIVDTGTLPHRYCAHTSCFRSEAGSAGKDTKGMLRQHQFYKVEMVSITTPEKSEEEHERMLGCAENVLKKLELPFRTVTLCSGDTGFGATKTYDIEVWLPGQETYREVSSISNCKDFQARRMNARTRVKGEKETRFVHTLNGSGVAVGRALIAVIENYYDPADGGVFVPEVLKPYMGGIEKIVKG